jgi:hypothetical protein
MNDPLETQVGGSHYKQMKIQPIEYIYANNIGYLEGNVIKYVSRWKDKGGVADLEKARHYLDILISLELYKKHEVPNVSSTDGSSNYTSEGFPHIPKV